MEKILLAINGHPPDTHTINFATYVANLTKSKLTALILKDREAELIHSDTLSKSYRKVMPMAAFDRRYVAMDVDQEVRVLLETCERKGVQSDVIVERESYEEYNSPAEQAIRASRFADLLILDQETSFKDNVGAVPMTFVRTVVSDSECPVVIAPASFDRIDDIVFCYDGDRSSVFAM